MTALPRVLMVVAIVFGVLLVFTILVSAIYSR
jgi:hypothetical protein